ncbi:WD domain-containing protein [Colletotrichum sojae]|uniref:Serine-threonine kinase receptor-associated protein n=1 Tax=Colletotrichum sojae TaxID=2175907 RepID=A0A8H6MIC2_9PEZI|nr:WD domain-containing protein [Colletotrichum sojae]
MATVPVSAAYADSRQYVPLTCHGHSRPVPHVCFSSLDKKAEGYHMISACKDGNPMLRDGITGDWIGTYIGHKGAVWQARLSPDGSRAATASADFTAKVWDSHNGEVLYTIQHNHIVRAVAYPTDNSDLIATGGHEKKLRVFDLSDFAADSNAAEGSPITLQASDAGFEIGEGTHQSVIKFIVWTKNGNTIVTAAGDTLSWFDLPTRKVIHQEVLGHEIKSCELVSLAPEYTSATDIGGGLPVLAVAAGKGVHFWGGPQARDELKRVELKHGVCSVGLDLKERNYVVGEEPGTWGRIYRWEDDVEIDILKGHHGPIWSIAFSPDGKLYATSSEDGTIKLWKNCAGFYGLWRGGGAAAQAERNVD